MLLVLINISIVALCWWAFAFGFAEGPKDYSGFVAGGDYFGSHLKGQVTSSVFLDFGLHIGFAILASSIAASGGAERISFGGWIIFTLLFSLFVFPIIAHWVFDPRGWLRLKYNFIDVAGSAAIHFCGGVACLVISLMIRPRINKWNDCYSNDFVHSNTTYIAFGTFI